jgi:peptidoglycan/xylan/chitin deacetylase (PgdA/CDA1 family)
MANTQPFIWHGGARAAVSLSFDDTRPSQLEHGIPVLDEHGIRATFYASPANMKGRTAAWRRVARSGHEIGNHTLVHPCSGNFTWSRGPKALEAYTLAKMERELRSANAFLRRTTGVTPRSFAYPCGQTFVGMGGAYRSYVPLVSRLFAAGRGFLFEIHNHPAYCELGHLAGINGDGFELRQYQERLDAALADGGWVIFCGHDVGNGFGYQTTRTRELDAFCRRLAKRHDVWTAPVAEIATWLKARRPRV